MNKVKGVCLILLFTFLAGCSNGQDFYGVNLDKGNQVERLHSLLVAGKVEHGGRVLHEWMPQGISDYDFSGGETVSFIYSQGDAELISRQRDELNFEFTKKFTENIHMMSQEWIPWEDDVEVFSYLDRYIYGNYAVSILYNIYSSTKNMTNPDSAELVIVLGVNQGE